MKHMISTFIADKDGAVTVDWVVLTAVIVGLGLTVISLVEGGITANGAYVAQGLQEATSFGR